MSISPTQYDTKYNTKGQSACMIVHYVEFKESSTTVTLITGEFHSSSRVCLAKIDHSSSLPWVESWVGGIVGCSMLAVVVSECDSPIVTVV